ncbi:MAG: hypothetical protein DDT26_00039 [Dehalococcoidia bacterium]|nr:hypothetical protein [Chloroflexota bacterium]
MTIEVKIARARMLLGVPYLHLGRDRNGIDCIGLLAYACAVESEKVPVYPADPVNGELERSLADHFGPAVIRGLPSVDELLVGDVLAIQYRGPVRHVAIVGDYWLPGHRFSMIHTDAALGRVVEHALDFKWIRRVCAVYR